MLLKMKLRGRRRRKRNRLLRLLRRLQRKRVKVRRAMLLLNHPLLIPAPRNLLLPLLKRRSQRLQLHLRKLYLLLQRKNLQKILMMKMKSRPRKLLHHLPRKLQSPPRKNPLQRNVLPKIQRTRKMKISQQRKSKRHLQHLLLTIRLAVRLESRKSKIRKRALRRRMTPRLQLQRKKKQMPKKKKKMKRKNRRKRLKRSLQRRRRPRRQLR